MEIDTNILNANEFENDFDDDFSFDVQKRGQDYYHNGNVLWVSKNKDNEFYAKVNGKNDNQYFVKIIKKGKYDYDYMIGIECNGGNKPSVGTDFANYSEINVTIILNEVASAVYESGSAVVKSIKDDDYITIEFKNFKCKTSSSQSYTFNGTVKLDYDVD